LIVLKWLCQLNRHKLEKAQFRSYSILVRKMLLARRYFASRFIFLTEIKYNLFITFGLRARSNIYTNRRIKIMKKMWYRLFVNMFISLKSLKTYCAYNIINFDYMNIRMIAQLYIVNLIFVHHSLLKLLKCSFTINMCRRVVNHAFWLTLKVPYFCFIPIISTCDCKRDRTSKL